ncbi:MAG: type 1 glutamine amidotransferase domain-containing protein [Bermanella sp.]
MQKLPVLIPLPSHDYDPSEVAVSWKTLTQAGFEVVFATQDGKPAQADAMMLSGEGLDPWGFMPFLKKIRFIGLMLRANTSARGAHQEMLLDKNYQTPLTYQALNPNDYSGLILPGGHAPRMRQYLEDKTLQSFVADFFDQSDEALASKSMVPKPVGAICHGVVLAARAISKESGKSVLFGKKTTALTWKLEKSAWDLTRFYARFWDSNYYRTYQEQPGEEKGYQGVQQEVTRALKSESDFLDVPNKTPGFLFKTLGVFRDSATNAQPAWVVRDGYYLSARWPGDVNTFAKRFVDVLKEAS